MSLQNLKVLKKLHYEESRSKELRRRVTSIQRVQYESGGQGESQCYSGETRKKLPQSDEKKISTSDKSCWSYALSMWGDDNDTSLLWCPSPKSLTTVYSEVKCKTNPHRGICQTPNQRSQNCQQEESEKLL